MNESQLYERRKKLVPSGLGIFSPSSATLGKNAIIKNADGKELIDFAGGIGAINAGHCPEPVVKAIQEQAQRLIHSSFNVAIYEVYFELAEKLISILPHSTNEAGTKVMILNSGAEAVENAVKIARQVKNRSAIISFVGGFHGRTMMAMSLTSKVAYKSNCGPFAPDTHKINFPYYNSDKNNSVTEEQFANRHISDLEYFFKSQVSADQVAAIIIELVQGEGGFYQVSEIYLKKLRQLCDKYGIVLIFDEIQTGFGRTGYWGAYQHYNVTPDMSTWAKSMGAGMPISAIVGKAEIMDKASAGTIGGTYCGNPVCCAAALAAINYMEKININQLGQKVGSIVKERLELFQKKFPNIVGEIRGIGAMLAFDIVNENGEPYTDLCKKILNDCAEKGLIIVGAGVYASTIRILSPLTIEESVLNKGLDILEKTLEYHNKK